MKRSAYKVFKTSTRSDGNDLRAEQGEVHRQAGSDCLGPRLTALKETFLLHGSYAPRDPKEAAQYGVKIIIADTPGPPGEFNQFIDMVPPKHPKNYGNGNPPAKKLEGDNGNKPEKVDPSSKD